MARGSLLRWTGSLVLSALSLWLAMRSLAWGPVVERMRGASLAPLLATLPLLMASYACRGRRWHGLYPERARRAGIRHATGILVIGFLLNNVLPARAGELVRVVMMRTRNALPPSLTVATLLSERAFDGLAIAAMALFAFVGDQGTELAWVQRGALALWVLFALALSMAAQRVRVAGWLERVGMLLPNTLRAPAVRFAHTALEGLTPLASPRALARALALTLLVWSFEALAYAAVARAFAMPLDAARLCAFISVVNLASLAPTPGGVGAIEFFGTLALTGRGVSETLAFVTVTALHAVQLAFCLVAGAAYALLVLRLPHGDQEERREGQGRAIGVGGNR